MNNNDIISFFNKEAQTWDLNAIKQDFIIDTIFDKAGINNKTDVLDVGCGTGVLIDDYLKRNVHSLTAIDISFEMIKVAKSKYPNIKFVCEDINNFNQGKYDVIMFYDCFPHINNKDKALKHANELLKENGKIAIAHSMSLDELHKHHKTVSHITEFLNAQQLKELISNYFDNIDVIDNSNMYMIMGEKNKHE